MKLEQYLEELRNDPEYVAEERELRPLLELADDILNLRLENQWSQSELARRAGTKQSNISRIESGLANPTLKFIQKLAKALGAEVEIRLRREQTAIESYQVRTAHSEEPILVD